MDRKIVTLGRAPAPKKRKRTSIGIGVAIWLGQPFVTVINGNRSDLLPVQVVFKHLFGGA